MVRIKEIVQLLQEFAPGSLQESYDNSGLTLGDQDNQCSGALLTIDITEEVVDEAINKKCNLIIAHHPLIFGGIKTLSSKNDVGRSIIKCIKNDVSVFIAHTNIDRVKYGVSWKMAEKLQLNNIKTLSPEKGRLKKLVTFVPEKDAEKLRDALFANGAGKIGNYDSCSYNTKGEGTFRGNENSTPYVGIPNTLHHEKEIRIELIFDALLETQLTESLLNNHPYEEVAFDILPLDNIHPELGFGVVAETSEPINTEIFLHNVLSTFQCQGLRHSPLTSKNIKKVALCGGSGFSLLNWAKASGADIFITGDIKYHQFFEAEEKIILADIGHFESEQFTKEIFYEIVQKKFPKFALHLSDTKTNPISYLF